MRDLVEPILTFKATKIRRTPCYSNRASEIGYAVPLLDGCLRRGVYARTAWQERELHDARVQLIFDEGNNQERIVLRDLAEAGVEIIEQQSAWEWSQYKISGHIDGTYIEDHVAFPVEIKSMSPNIFEGVNIFEDFKKHPWTRVYMAQITLYMLFKNIDKGIFILKNKSTGELKQITVDLDFELGEAILKAAETINAHIAAGTLPECIQDREVCKKCPFKLVCLPEIDFGVELKIQDNPAFESKVDRYLSIKETAKEATALWDEIKDYAKETAEKGELNIICGKYKIVGTTNGRGFSMKIDKI